jgi:hypothetical protein
LANCLQNIIDGSIDNRLESVLDNKVYSAMLHVNDETAKNNLNLPNLVLHQLSLVLSVIIIKIVAITLIQSRSIVF